MSGSKDNSEWTSATKKVGRRKALLAIGSGVSALSLAPSVISGDAPDPEPEEFCTTSEVTSGRTGDAPNCFVQGGMSSPSRTRIIVEFDTYVTGTVYVALGSAGSNSCPITASEADFVLEFDYDRQQSTTWVNDPADEIGGTVDVPNANYTVKAEECI